MTWVPENPTYKRPKSQWKYICHAWEWWGFGTETAEFPADTGERDMQAWMLKQLDKRRTVKVSMEKVSGK